MRTANPHRSRNAAVAKESTLLLALPQLFAVSQSIWVLFTFLLTYLTIFLAKAMPFRIQFLSDQWEFAAIEAGANVGIVGFKLRYFQTSC